MQRFEKRLRILVEKLGGTLECGNIVYERCEPRIQAVLKLI